MKIKTAPLWHTHIFAKEADPHREVGTAHTHSEVGLYERVGHTRQVHVVIPAVLQGLKPGEIFDKQEESVVVDTEVLCVHAGLLQFIWNE